MINCLYFEDNLISVIIPVFRCEKHIRECINSVLNQTTKYRVEVVLVDDCSPDNSGVIVSELMRLHENIRYERLEKNSGAAVARNRALDLARGRYIAFLDSDDVWLSSKLDRQLALMIEKRCAFIYGAIELINENGNVIKQKRKIPKKISYRQLLRNTAIATSTVLLDRKLIGDFRMPLIRSGQDYATWLMLLRDCKVAYGVTDLVAKYRKSDGSLSSKKTKNWKKVFNIQVNYEGIPKFHAYINCMCYIVHAINKYLL